MCKKYTYSKTLLIFAILIMLNVSLFLINHKQNSQTNLKQSSEFSFLSSKYNAIYGNVFIQLLSENYYISNIEIENMEGKTSFIQTILSDNPKLIFRFNGDHCHSCVDEALKSLLKNSKDIGIQNIIILSSYKNTRELRAFVKSKNLDILIFNTTNVLKIPIEKYNTPYFFVLDNSMVAKLVFIPIKEIQGHTDDYLSVISKRFYCNFEN